MKRILVVSALAMLSFGALPIPHYAMQPAYAQSVTTATITNLVRTLQGRINDTADVQQRHEAQQVLNTILTQVNNPRRQHEYLTALAKTPDTSKWKQTALALQEKNKDRRKGKEKENKENIIPGVPSNYTVSNIGIPSDKSEILRRAKSEYFNSGGQCKEPQSSDKSESAMTYRSNMQELAQDASLTPENYHEHIHTVIRNYCHSSVATQDEGQKNDTAKEDNTEKDVAAEKAEALKQLKVIYFDSECKEPTTSSKDSDSKKYLASMTALEKKKNLSVADYRDEAQNIMQTYSEASCTPVEEGTGCEAKKTEAEKKRCLEEERLADRKKSCEQAGMTFDSRNQTCQPKSTTTTCTNSQNADGSTTQTCTTGQGGQQGGGGGGGQGKGLEDMMKKLGQGGGGGNQGGGGSQGGGSSPGGSDIGSAGENPSSTETGSTSNAASALWQQAEGLHKNETGTNDLKVNCEENGNKGKNPKQRVYKNLNEADKCTAFADQRVKALKECIEKSAECPEAPKACEALKSDYGLPPPKSCEKKPEEGEQTGNSPKKKYEPPEQIRT